MANKKKTETAPEQEGAVLNQEVVAETETVIDEVIKDALDATNEAKIITEAVQEEQQQGVNEAQAKADAEAKAPKYGFTADAPQSIRYNGEVYTQEEVLTNEDLLAELVQGKCIFIKRN